MADGTHTHTRTVAHTALTCRNGQQGTSSGDYYAPAERQFAPVRHGNAVQSFTDGCSAMHAMAEAIRGAKKFIFIADWQLNIDTEMVRIVPSFVLGAAALDFGVAFGMATGEIVRNIVTGFYTRKFLAMGKTLEIAGQSGVLTAITATHAILNSEGQDIIIANSTFLDQTSKQ